VYEENIAGSRRDTCRQRCFVRSLYRICVLKIFCHSVAISLANTCKRRFDIRSILFCPFYRLQALSIMESGSFSRIIAQRCSETECCLPPFRIAHTIACHVTRSQQPPRTTPPPPPSALSPLAHRRSL